CGCLADVDAVAVDRKRIAQAFAGSLQRTETLQGQVAEGVHAAADHRVAKPGIQQPPGAEQGACAGSAGGGYAVAGAGQLQPVAEETRRGRELLVAVVVVVWQLPVLDQPGDALAGLLDAGGTGAQHHADTPGTVARDGRADLWFDLLRGRQQQLIVARLVVQVLERQGRKLAGNRADRQLTAGNRLRVRLHAAGITGQQARGHFSLASAESAEHAE